MRLLFFIGSLVRGGAERVLVNISSELANRGHDVVIALNDNAIEYEATSMSVVAAPARHYIKGKDPISVFIRRVQLKKHHRKHVKTIIKKAQPDVIISFQQCNTDAILRYHNNIPIVLSEHNAYDRNLGLEHYFLRFFISRFYDKVFLLTPFDQGYAKAKGLKNTVVMPNPNTFESIFETDYKDTFYGRKNILVCGRLDVWRVKGFDLAIQVFSSLANDFPNVELDIVGGGSDASNSQIERIANQFGVKDRVHLLGRRDDVKELMRNHQVFILSSRTEGFPMVLTEAMSQGLPCVSFDKIANSIINNSIDGYLVSDGDVKEMAAIVSQLLQNNTLRYRIGLAALNNVKRFSPEIIADRWEKILFQLKHS